MDSLKQLLLTFNSKLKSGLLNFMALIDIQQSNCNELLLSKFFNSNGLYDILT